MAQGRQLQFNEDTDWNQMNPYTGQQALLTPENEEEDSEWMESIFAVRDDEAWSSDKMTAKVPPAYDGISSFFAYEEYVEEWLLITTIEAEKQAPLLRFRLKGNALTEKTLEHRTAPKTRFNQAFPGHHTAILCQGPCPCFSMAIPAFI